MLPSEEGQMWKDLAVAFELFKNKLQETSTNLREVLKDPKRSV